jgi:phosphomannomutase
LGRATTPCVAFCSRKLGASITASHNPPEYTGMKPFRERRCFYGEDLAQLKAYYAQEESAKENAKENAKESAASPAQKKVRLEEFKKLKENNDEVEKYLDSLPEFEGGVYDLGGGAACAFKKIFPRDSAIFSEPDPLFSKRAPEPKDETLGALKEETLKRGAVGFAFDGDADRLIVVDEGRTVDSSALGAFYASRFLKRGDVVALTIDVSGEVCDWLSARGLHVNYSAVGDINVTRKADEAAAAFSMERSGHYAVTKHLLYSDALYFAALLSSARPGEITAFASQFKNAGIADKENARVNFRDLEKLFREKNPARIETLDGIKAWFDDYCVLVRASQTEPFVRITIEAKTRDAAVKGLENARKLVRKAAA